MLDATGAAAQRERAALVACGLDPDALPSPPRGVRLRGARRAFRVPVPDAAADSSDADALRLRFTLPPGSYATVLVEEVVRPDDASAGDRVKLGPPFRAAARRGADDHRRTPP